MKSVARLLANGIAEFHHEICNTGSEGLDEGIYLLTNFGFFGNRLILPYQGQYVDMGDAYSSDPDHWDSAGITENWLFNQGEAFGYGICWDPSLKLLRPEYTVGLEHDLGPLSPGAVVRTKKTVFALNAFANWWDFRSFAQKRRELVVPVLDDHLGLAIGGGNPFKSGELNAELIERKLIPLAGSMDLYVQNGEEEERKAVSIELRREEDLRSALFEFFPGEKGAREKGESAWKVRAVYHGEDRIQERAALWFPQSEADIVCRIEEGLSGPVYTVSNDVLSLASAPGFGSVVHSLKYQGEEWLDSSYPEAVPHSWWNPWYGGLGVEIPGMSGFSRQQEPRSADWAERTDVHGNVWRGLRLTTSIEKQEANQGITINQHYLMLPGVPVLCILHSVTNGSGLVLPHYSLTANNFFKPSAAFSEGYMEIPGEGRFLLGKLEAHLNTKGLLRMGAVSRQDMLHVVSHYPHQSSSAYANNKVFNNSVHHPVSLLNRKTFWTQPVFLILGRIALNPEDIRSLLKLTFANTVDGEEVSHADH